MCGRFQLVRFLTPIELSNFPSNTKIIKNKPDSETRATCTLQKMKPGWIAESSWGYILCTTQGQRTTKNVCSCKPSYRLQHASLTGKSSLLTKEKSGQILTTEDERGQDDQSHGNFWQQSNKRQSADGQLGHQPGEGIVSGDALCIILKIFIQGGCPHSSMPHASTLTCCLLTNTQCCYLLFTLFAIYSIVIWCFQTGEFPVTNYKLSHWKKPPGLTRPSTGRPIPLDQSSKLFQN